MWEDHQFAFQAGSLGIVPPGRGNWQRGRGRGRGRGHNTHRFIRSGANLDRRPSELRISGFQEAERDEMISHFAVIFTLLRIETKYRNIFVV